MSSWLQCSQKFSGFPKGACALLRSSGTRLTSFTMANEPAATSGTRLYKTQKTHCGTLVEINLQLEFRAEFADGKALD